ncbi:MAG: GntR family transcriptional regulator [Sphingopyxis sp.]|jgi:DNA-binding GntR family transcriptional regulator|uniref:GntR family transcriptional regulator n=1 Tax=Sphingopyxis sp. TaxID=1908224 RepID=UPI001A613B19|nr:GntR family transcriptional regulator [Sphingopyxis sp.]MBL9071868.1 GntR family transcriptional regulator [Sphingopyxis sp.]
MSPSHVVEPTYQAIKRRLMAGDWPMGMRIEAARLADELGVSMTPVRDSLFRLVGERMVDFSHGEGFRVHRLTEIELRDMLELHLILALAALATSVGARQEQPGEPLQLADDADRAARLFGSLARRSGNSEIALAIASLGDRLHLARASEASVIGETGTEMDALEDATRGAHIMPTIRDLMLRYHERRAREAAAIVRLLAGEAS